MNSIQVKIRNFQSIKDIDFEIKGFTCITGKTNIGKSSIIRAISGAILNIPVVGLVRHGEKYVTVELQSSDWGFKWEKGEKGINRYWLPEREKPLDKVGVGQVDFIQEMGFRSTKIGSDTVNPWYASQFYPIFLIDRSGPAITDFISEISRLKVLQNAIIINVRNKKRLIDESRLHENNTEKLKLKNNKLDKLNDLLKLESELDSQLESIEECGERILEIEEFMSKINNLSNSIRYFSQIELVNIPILVKFDKFQKLQKMIKIWSKLELLAKKIIKLKLIEKIQISADLGLDHSQTWENLQRLAKGVNIQNRIQILKKMVNLLSVEIFIPDLEEATKKLECGKTYLGEIESLKNKERLLSGKKDTIQVELDEVEEKLSKIPLCPTCKTPMSNQVGCSDH